MEKLIAVLALVVQLLNAGAFFFEMYLPEQAFVIAAVVGGIQAFLGKVQSGSVKKK